MSGGKGGCKQRDWHPLCVECTWRRLASDLTAIANDHEVTIKWWKKLEKKKEKILLEVKRN